ncbi:MAG TPA: hypothetical protein VJB94_01670 [Candidatus Nanoarchaeia archaeon]|nr:hypothetical protein [Candidatus Nanoarchaeia archaeon]
MPQKIDLLELIKDKYTYPNWSTGRQYKLEGEILSRNKILIYYIATNHITKRKFQKIFPRYIYLTPSFCWVLGFFKAEGLSSIKNKAYYRFNITNKKPLFLKKVFTEIEKAGLLLKDEIKGRCFQIHHFKNDPEIVKKYWSNNLEFPIEMFVVRDYNHNLTKEGNGVCHFDISNVLLRRVLDLINDKVIE